MATTNNKNTWTYDEFKKSQATTDADKNRQSIAANKPGEFTYNPYVKSNAVKQAEANAQQHRTNNNPGKFSYSQQTGFDDIWNQIQNREKFSYDLNGDALYQQYKDQYMRQGQLAMEDTMGQAAALTGGYGNSYAQQAGQQAYNGYLQQLNDKVPELYQLALDQYNREGQDLYNQYALHSDRYAQEYGQHRDKVSDYYTELDYLTDEARYLGEQDYGRYMDAYQMAYGQHRDEVGDWQNALNRADNEYWNQYNADYGQYSDNRNLSYQQYRNQVSDDQWQKTFDEGIRQFNVSQSSGSKYKSLDVGDDAYNTILSDIDAVEDIDGLKDLAARYISLDYSPDQIKAMVSAKADALSGPTENATAFIEKMDKATESWDAIARHQYGSEKMHIAQQIENSNLTDDEKAYLISHYGITELDLDYKKGHS